MKKKLDPDGAKIVASVENSRIAKAKKSGRRLITEKDGLQKEWYEQAKKQTSKTLGKFVNELLERYQHDYGTIVHAAVAAALAGAHVVDHHPEQGGITGFQAGCIMWEFIHQWMGFEGPISLVRFEHMLYPQYKSSFSKTISKETWVYLQERAKKLLLENPKAHQNVRAHWGKIGAGMMPFGFKVAKE